MILTTALSMLGCNAYAIQPENSDGPKLYPRFFDSLERKIQGGFISYLDVVQVTDMILQARKKSANRKAFVKNALLQGIYSCQGNCSVLVFDLAGKYKWNNEPDIKHTIFTTERYGNFNYGIWIFTDPAIFRNLGPTDIDHWAYYGRLEKDGNVLFYDAMGSTIPNATEPL